MLPPSAEPAVAIIRRLREQGHEALLAGGCVRDLLRGAAPADFDVATSAPPDEVCRLFRSTRKVGAAFGVVLVRSQDIWVEVATFRADGRYLDGRRPESVTFTDARHDAQRRDFTINGMFLDPIAGQVIDHVGGRPDLAARLIRAIGLPDERFAEDHLRLLRAVRFAARLDFAIEPATLASIQSHTSELCGVAAERVREELEKMLGAPSRAIALRLLMQTGLLPYLCRNATWSQPQATAAVARMALLPQEASFELAFATLLLDRAPADVGAICRALAFSNEQREACVWLVQEQAALDSPSEIGLARLKRLMAHSHFGSLRELAETRYMARGDTLARDGLAARVAAIAPESIRPPPLVTGDDLIARGIQPGPIFSTVLDELYWRQLDETLTTREDALKLLAELLARQR